MPTIHDSKPENTDFHEEIAHLFEQVVGPSNAESTRTALLEATRQARPGIAVSDTTSMAELLKAIEEFFEPKRRELIELARRAVPGLNLPDDALMPDIIEAINAERPEWDIKNAHHQLADSLRDSPLIEQIEAFLRIQIQRARKKHATHLAKIPAALPQPTFYETRRLCQAISDGPTLSNWYIGDSQNRATIFHNIGENEAEVFLYRTPRLEEWGTDNTPDALKNELQSIDADAIFTLKAVISLMLNNDHHEYSLDDLILLVGRGNIARLSEAQRQEIRRAVWRVVVLGASCVIRGKRPGLWRNPVTGEKEEVRVSHSLYLVDGIGERKQGSLFPGEPPLFFELIQSPFIRQYIGESKFFDSIGDIRAVAQRAPAMQPAGHWARVIFLNLNQIWRERVQRSDISISIDQTPIITSGPITRRQLLNGYYKASKPSVDSILEGGHPKRAIEYAKKAFVVLKKAGVISDMPKELKKAKLITDKLAGWKDEWLDQPLQITPGQPATVEKITGMIERRGRREAARKTTKAETRSAGKQGRPRKVRKAA